MLAYAYNTNGFAHHRLGDALRLLSELGYDGVALTLDVHHLDPTTATDFDVARAAKLLADLGLRVVVETGARYILDPRRKHYPALVSEGWRERLAYLCRCLDMAAALGAEAMAVHSGCHDPLVAPEVAERQLELALGEICARAEPLGVAIGFEPEPGMVVESLADYDRLRASVGDQLKLTLDLGHVRCTEQISLAEAVGRYAQVLVNVHVEDIRGTEHNHLPFGCGDLDLAPALRALEEIAYAGLVGVELSRNSHDAPYQTERSLPMLRALGAQHACGTHLPVLQGPTHGPR